MAEGYQESKGAVTVFLTDLQRILEDRKLDFRLLSRTDKRTEYTTDYCLRELRFTKKDIINEVKKLTHEDYIETCNDERNHKSNRYYVFGKRILGKEIYIKIKIESYDEKIVLCMSFHFAEYHITKFPYKR